MTKTHKIIITSAKIENGFVLIDLESFANFAFSIIFYELLRELD